jgi:hypothetical protein
MFKRLGTLNAPTIRFRWAFLFGALSVRSRYNLVICSPPGRITPRHDCRASRDFYVRASDDSVSLLAAEYDYGVNWAIYTDGTCTR